MTAKQIMVRVKPGLRLAEAGSIYEEGQVMMIDEDRLPAIHDLVETVSVAETVSGPFPGQRDTSISSPPGLQTQHMPSPAVTRRMEPRKVPAKKTKRTGKKK